MSDRSCAACVFFEATTEPPLLGACRRNAPRPAKQRASVWPEVSRNDWCGEFHPQRPTFGNCRWCGRPAPACGDPGCLDCSAHGDSVKKLTADIEAHLKKQEAAKETRNPWEAMRLGLEVVADGIHATTGIEAPFVYIALNPKLYARLKADYPESPRWAGARNVYDIVVGGHSVELRDASRERP